MLKHIFWQKSAKEMVICIAIAICVGYIFGYILLSIIIALLLFLIWNIFNLNKLSTWIWKKNTLYPPSILGSLDVVSYGLHKRQRRNRQKQNELARMIKQFRHGAESIPDSLLLVNHEGKIEWCNKITFTQLHIRWPDDKGQNVMNLIRDPAFINYMKKKNFQSPLTLFFQNQVHIEFRIMPYIHDHWIIIARNVEHLYLAEKQRHDFFSNASHEFKTPLTVIKGYLDMFNDGLISSEKQNNVFAIMQSQIEKMESLTNQILTLSQIENHSIKNEIQQICIANILIQIEKDIRQMNPNYNFKFNIDKDLLISGHKEQMFSVVSNLIYNSLKHTQEGTTITVNWKRTNMGAFFSVEDTGNGIQHHHLNRLTERFYKVDDARTPSKNSTGLGLAIVKHALLNHSNTKLNIDSEWGKGSCFSFTLPNNHIISTIDQHAI